MKDSCKNEHLCLIVTAICKSETFSIGILVRLKTITETTRTHVERETCALTTHYAQRLLSLET